MNGENLHRKPNKKSGYIRLPFYVLLALLWCRNTIYPYVYQVIKRIPVIESVSDEFLLILIIIAIIWSMPYLLQRVILHDVLFFAAMVTIVLLSGFVFPENADFIFNDLSRIVSAMLMLFAGIAYDHELCKKELYWLSLIGVIVRVLYIFYFISSGRDATVENMSAAYDMLPSSLYLIYWAIEKKRLLHWIPAIVSIAMIVSFGTRGAVACILIFLVLGICIGLCYNAKMIKKIIVVMILAVLLLVVYNTDILENIAKLFAEWLSDKGLSTRVLDAFLEGRITESGGRDKISEIVWKSVWENPVLGNGVMGDRVATFAATGTATYAHNIAKEMWCDFGIVFGTVIFGAVIIIPLRATIISKTVGVRLMILLLTVSSVGMLMFSGSYLVNAELFFMIGAGIAVIRNTKKETVRVVRKKSSDFDFLSEKTAERKIQADSLPDEIDDEDPQDFPKGTEEQPDGIDEN